MNKIAGLFLSVFLVAVTLTWDAPLCTDYDCAEGYKVYCGSASGVYGTPVDVMAALEHPISTPGKYYCAATAYNTGGESGFSNEVFFTLKSAPAAPVNLRLRF
ncbi:MAG: fibronectin type III domain-containing protein [Patescibacteria group bacterium]